LFLHLVDAATDGAVDDGVADPGDDASEHVGVDDDLDLDGLAGRATERLREPSGLCVVERDGATDLGDLLVALRCGELDESLDDRGGPPLQIFKRLNHHRIKPFDDSTRSWSMMAAI
jgi:hypothetical protein